MSKAKNIRPTNMDSLFDAVPLESAPLSKLPAEVQADIVCGCGFYGLKDTVELAGNIAETETKPAASGVIAYEDGPSVSLKDRANALINANDELSNRNMAEGRVAMRDYRYGDPGIRLRDAHNSARENFKIAFGFDELIASGMPKTEVVAMFEHEFKEYEKVLGGKGANAKKRAKSSKLQQKILESL